MTVERTRVLSFTDDPLRISFGPRTRIGNPLNSFGIDFECRVEKGHNKFERTQLGDSKHLFSYSSLFENLRHSSGDVTD